MSNELPQPPTEMCEPVFIGTPNIKEWVSTKKCKQSWYVFFGYYRRGRIKRMRKPKKMQDYYRTKTIRLKAVKDKYRIWELLWLQNCEYIFPLTRWNRH